MDEYRFPPLTRALTRMPSRRDVLRGLAGAGLGLGIARWQRTADAKQKRKNKNKNEKKKKKPKLNSFGCVDVGKACQGKNGKCCSGICQGKKPKKGQKDRSRCVAHNAGICTADTDTCTVGVNVPCNPSNPSCFCTLTTGNAGFCGAFSGGTAGHCRICRKDSDCHAEFGAGAACLLLGGVCTPLCATTGRTACAPPCA